MPPLTNFDFDGLADLLFSAMTLLFLLPVLIIWAIASSVKPRRAEESGGL